MLKEPGVAYVFLGNLVGGKPDDPVLLGPDGQPDYVLVAASPAFGQGIDRLVKGQYLPSPLTGDNCRHTSSS